VQEDNEALDSRGLVLSLEAYFITSRAQGWTQELIFLGGSKRREQDQGFVCCILERIQRSDDLKESNRSAVGSAEIRCDHVPTGSNGGHRSAVAEPPRGDLKKTG